MSTQSELSRDLRNAVAPLHAEILKLRAEVGMLTARCAAQIAEGEGATAEAALAQLRAESAEFHEFLLHAAEDHSPSYAALLDRRRIDDGSVH